MSARVQGRHCTRAEGSCTDDTVGTLPMVRVLSVVLIPENVTRRDEIL